MSGKTVVGALQKSKTKKERRGDIFNRTNSIVIPKSIPYKPQEDKK